MGMRNPSVEQIVRGWLGALLIAGSLASAAGFDAGRFCPLTRLWNRLGRRLSVTDEVSHAGRNDRSGAVEQIAGGSHLPLVQQRAAINPAADNRLGEGSHSTVGEQRLDRGGMFALRAGLNLEQIADPNLDIAVLIAQRHSGQSTTRAGLTGFAHRSRTANGGLPLSGFESQAFRWPYDGQIDRTARATVNSEPIAEHFLEKPDPAVEIGRDRQLLQDRRVLSLDRIRASAESKGDLFAAHQQQNAADQHRELRASDSGRSVGHEVDAVIVAQPGAPRNQGEI